jgi:hypothetical protein
MPLLAFNTGSSPIKIFGIPVTVPPSPSTSSLLYFNVTSYLGGSTVQDFYQMEQQRLSSSLGYVWSGVINFDCRPLTPTYGIPEPLGALLGTPPYVPPPLGEDGALLIEHPVGEFIWTKLTSDVLAQDIQIFDFELNGPASLELGDQIVDPQFFYDVTRLPFGARGFSGFVPGTFAIVNSQDFTTTNVPNPSTFGVATVTGAFTSQGSGPTSVGFELIVQDAASPAPATQISGIAFNPRVYFGAVQQQTFVFTPETVLYSDDFETDSMTNMGLDPAWNIINPPLGPGGTGPQRIGEIQGTCDGNGFFDLATPSGSFQMFLGSLPGPYQAPPSSNTLPGYSGFCLVYRDFDLTLVPPDKGVHLQFIANGATNDTIKFVNFNVYAQDASSMNMPDQLLQTLFSVNSPGPYQQFDLDLTPYIGTVCRVYFQVVDDRIGIDPICVVVDQVQVIQGSNVASNPLVFDEAFVLALPGSLLESSRQINPGFIQVPAGFRYYYAIPISYGTPFFQFDFSQQPVHIVATITVTNHFGVQIPMRIWESVNENWEGGAFASLQIF